MHDWLDHFCGPWADEPVWHEIPAAEMERAMAEADACNHGWWGDGDPRTAYRRQRRVARSDANPRC